MHQKTHTHTLLQHHLGIPEPALVDLAPFLIHATSIQHAIGKQRGPARDMLRGSMHQKKHIHTLLQQHLCIPEPAHVELATFLISRQHYLAMLPLYNLQLPSRGG